MHHRSSLTPSDTTYHSFNDIELFEPPSPPKNTHKGQNIMEQVNEERPPTAIKMQRQDSGYESYTATPRSSTSQSSSSSRPTVHRRVSSASNGHGVSSRPRTRPSTHRSAKSYPPPKPNQSLYLAHSNHNTQPQPVSYFHFPSPEPIELTESPLTIDIDLAPQLPAAPSSLPQTTHYWTSDDTRRLEYAAMDAASRGFKGWIRRRLIPDCFIPKESKHLAFDDDTGSVRRYRLDLEEEEVDEKLPCRRRKGWQFWLRRNNI